MQYLQLPSYDVVLAQFFGKLISDNAVTTDITVLLLWAC